MANFLDDLGAALKKAAGDVQNEVTVTAREQKLKDTFQKLGKLYYETVTAGLPTVGGDFDGLIGEIWALQKEISDLRSHKNSTGK